MNETNDIFENLNPEVDITDTYKNKEIETEEYTNNSTNDIIENNEEIDISKSKHAKIYKLNTKNFDSITNNKKIKDINLLEKKSKNNIKEKNKIINKKNTNGNNFKKIFSYFKIKSFHINRKLKITSYIFLILGALIISDKIIVENRISSGYKKIISIKNNLGDINHITNTINDAKYDFVISDILFLPFNLISENTNINNGNYLIKGGKNLTILFDKGIQMYLAIETFINKAGGIHNIYLTNLLTNIKSDFVEITNLLYITINNYEHVNNLPDIDLNNKLNYAKKNLKEIYTFLDIFNKDFDIFLNLLGHEKAKKYLILFQNNDEIRPTGGFIGSMALVTIKKGKIIEFTKDDIYAYEWEINKNYHDKLPAPGGLNLITENFYLRDSNNSVSFEKSSENIKFFMDKMNENIDGIIYINQNTILDFIDLVGGVEFSQLEEKITTDNFSLILSTLVEAQSFKVGTLGTPKKILFDFANEFLEIIKNKKDYFSYLEIIYKNIKSRDLVIYSLNSEENNLLWKLGLNGKIKYSDTIDYTYPVYTSIAGNKSDRYISINYKKEIIKNIDCSIDTTFNINRTHNFSKKDEKKVNDLLNKYPIKDKSREDIIHIQGKGGNKVYTKIILPKQAIVKPKEGMSINKYDTSTVLEFFIETRLSEETNFEINYKIPNKDCKDYSYKLYKQPGIKEYDIEINKNGEIYKEKNIKNDFIY